MADVKTTERTSSPEAAIDRDVEALTAKIVDGTADSHDIAQLQELAAQRLYLMRPRVSGSFRISLKRKLV